MIKIKMSVHRPKKVKNRVHLQNINRKNRENIFTFFYAAKCLAIHLCNAFLQNNTFFKILLQCLLKTVAFVVFCMVPSI